MQERGRIIRVYHQGDVVKRAPNLARCNDASPNSKITHIALNPNAKNGMVKWLQQVTNAKYQQL